MEITNISSQDFRNDKANIENIRGSARKGK